MLSWLLTLLCCVNICYAPAPYSNDLRTAVVYKRLVLNISASIVASINRISVRSVQRYVERFIELDSVLPDPQLFDDTRGRNATVTRQDLSLLIQIVIEDSTLYLDEIRDELINRGGAAVHTSQIHRWLIRLGYTRQRLFRVKICLIFCYVAQGLCICTVCSGSTCLECDRLLSVFNSERL